MTKQNQHVVPYLDKWAVKGEGSSRVTSTHRTQSAALNAARLIAKRLHSEVVTHRPDGTIRDKDSYGPDPYPPKDKKN